MSNVEIQWSLVLFTALAGMGGWSLLGVFIDTVRDRNTQSARFTTVISLIIMAVGGVASATHLGHPERMFAVLGHPTVGIFTEAVLLGISAVAAIIFFVLASRNAGKTARSVFIGIAALFGVALSFMSGYSYIMASVPSWNTIFLPIGYLGTSATMGFSLYAVLILSYRKAACEIKGWGNALCIAGIVSIVTCILYAIGSGVAGDYILLWVICIVLSGVVPAALGYLAEHQGAPKAQGSQEVIAEGKEEPKESAETEDSKDKPQETAQDAQNGQVKGKALPLFIASLVCSLIGALVFRGIMWLSWAPIANYFSDIIG